MHWVVHLTEFLSLLFSLGVENGGERRMKGCDSGERVERKTVEKNRRIHMKALCFKLSSLIPTSSDSKDSLTQQDHLERAAAYIKTLRERIDRLKQKKETSVERETESAPSMTAGIRDPMVEIRALESTVEAVLICACHRRSLLYDVIALFDEEGADVVNASFSDLNDRAFYTVHAQVRCPRIGTDASRLTQRLKALVGHY